MQNDGMIIKVFVSSPSDVVSERREVDKIIDEINHTPICRDNNVIVQALKYEKDVVPGMGNPQDIIDDQISGYQIFLGIMWSRFGTPTGSSESGTEKEFNNAFKIWSERKNLRILFYFSQETISPKTHEDLDQYKKILDFKNKLKGLGLITEYKNPQMFAISARTHLTSIVQDIVLNKLEIPLKEIKPAPNISASMFAENHFKHFETLHSGQLDNFKSLCPGSYSSFKCSADDKKFIKLCVPTTTGLNNESGNRKEEEILLIADPIRPYLIQIGKTRQNRNKEDPKVIPELLSMQKSTLEGMYPFIYTEEFKWIRMVIAELSTNQDVLEYISKYDPDHDVRKTAAKNPSANSALMSQECPFCNAIFYESRVRGLEYNESNLTRIIRNDFPYGPFFHYMAIPRSPVHTWEDITSELLVDMNLLIFHFLSKQMDIKKLGAGKSRRRLNGAVGVHIGLNSTIRHLVMTRHSRASAGASIAHIHKQIWGMTEMTTCLSDHIAFVNTTYEKNKIDYLGAYLDCLNKFKFIIWQDRNVALYVPIGQISVHEIQVMVKHKGMANYLDLNDDVIRSLSIAEFITIQIFKKIGISSFNEVMISQPFDAKSQNCRLIISFITREIDLAVSELNHLYVVDKDPETSIKEIAMIKDDVERICKVTFDPSFGAN